MPAIVTLILSAVPWQAIFGILLKLVFAIFDKNEKYKESKKLMLRLINEVDRQVPIRVRNKYKKDIEILMAELKQEEIYNKNNAEKIGNYKKAYLSTLEDLDDMKVKYNELIKKRLG